MSEVPGRNDPCWCGSGEKYKYCHLERDQQRGHPPTPMGVVSAFSIPSLLENPEFQAWSRDTYGREGMEEIEAVDRLAETMVQIEQRRDELRQISDQLNSYRSQFCRLLEDVGALLDRANEVFSNPPFNQYRYGVEELKDAFEAVGYPNRTMFGSDDMVSSARNVRDHHVGETTQTRMVMEFMLEVPRHVEQGRYMDALLISHSAYHMDEDSDSVSPFWFDAFLSAFDRWRQSNRRSDARYSEGFQIDPEELEERSTSDILEQYRNMLDDSRDRKPFEQLLEKVPEFKQQGMLSRGDMKEAVLEFVQRDDIGELLLTREEILAHQPLIEDRVGSVVGSHYEEYLEHHPDEELEVPPPEEVLTERELDSFRKDMMLAIGETAYIIAEEVWNADRRSEWVERLKTVRDRFNRAGDRRGARQAKLALQSLCLSFDGGFFLRMLTVRSLEEVMQQARATLKSTSSSR